MPILNLEDGVLHLGYVDNDSFDQFTAEKKAYFERYHARFWNTYLGNNALKPKLTQFRGEGKGEWIEPIKGKGNDVKKLQTFLANHGFMPNATINGVFDYRTHASVRLFQEYVRTIEGIDIGIADARVGSGTLKEMERWKNDNLMAEWGKTTWQNPSKEFQLWMKLLNQARGFYEKALANADDPAKEKDVFQLQLVDKWTGATDTRKIKQWSFDPKEVHLLGIRCGHEFSNKNRDNDDLFVLLINGNVFKFWGSTDPKPSRSDSESIKGHEPYLIEGQHKYRFSWHKRGDSGKVYKALVPYQNGVLVFRDWDNEDALSDTNIRKYGLGNPTNNSRLNNPNFSINIHWTQDTNNWSAGCQVIAGSSYINNRGKLIDVSHFAAQGYSALSKVSERGVKKNQGAYSFISDLALVYTPAGIDHVVYTLGQDSLFEKEGLDTKDLIQNIAAPELGVKSIHDLLHVLKG